MNYAYWPLQSKPNPSEDPWKKPPQTTVNLWVLPVYLILRDQPLGSFGKPRCIVPAPLLKWGGKVSCLKDLYEVLKWVRTDVIFKSKQATSGCGTCKQGGKMTIMTKGGGYESLKVMWRKCRWHKQEFEAFRRGKQRIIINILRFQSNLSTFLSPALFLKQSNHIKNKWSDPLLKNSCW